MFEHPRILRSKFEHGVQERVSWLGEAIGVFFTASQNGHINGVSRQVVTHMRRLIGAPIFKKSDSR
ncbi:MAG: hypothetical protein BECKG1743F_GA0114225_102723 [Candidatus Kentron sp. G]|nr:MAG: hypothetical protein BECKG1743F_GA0114225_102723 [Candidatus Kentron sp. G]